MRFYKKEKPVIIKEEVAKIGDIKEIVKFAYLPIKINDKCTVWLENYNEVYKFQTNYQYYEFNFFKNNKLESYNDWSLIERKFLTK